MFTLLLLSESEQERINTEIFASCSVSTDALKLEELLTDAVDSIAITSRYVDTVGYKRVINFFKAALIIKPIRFTYFCNTLEIDSFSKYLLKDTIEPIIVRHRIIDLDYPAFKDIMAGKEPNVFDFGSLGKREKNYSDVVDFIDRIPEDPDQQSDFIKNQLVSVIDSFQVLKSLHQENEQQSLQLEQLIKDNGFLQGKVQSLNFSLERSYRNIQDLNSKLNSALNYLTKYKNDIDNYNEVVRNSYEALETTYITEDKKLIFYFKEFEDTHFYDVYRLLIDTLENGYKYFIKSLIIEPPYHSYYNRFYRDGYTRIVDKTTYKEVAANDHLIYYGNAKRILEFLTKAEVKYDALFIFDRLNTYRPVIDKAPNLYNFYLATKRDYLDNVEIPDEIFISPYEGSYKEDYDTFNAIIDKDISTFSGRIILHRTKLFNDIKRTLDLNLKVGDIVEPKTDQ